MKTHNTCRVHMEPQNHWVGLRKMLETTGFPSQGPWGRGVSLACQAGLAAAENVRDPFLWHGARSPGEACPRSFSPCGAGWHDVAWRWRVRGADDPKQHAAGVRDGEGLHGSTVRFPKRRNGASWGLQLLQSMEVDIWDISFEHMFERYDVFRAPKVVLQHKSQANTHPLKFRLLHLLPPFTDFLCSGVFAATEIRLRARSAAPVLNLREVAVARRSDGMNAPTQVASKTTQIGQPNRHPVPLGVEPYSGFRGSLAPQDDLDGGHYHHPALG